MTITKKGQITIIIIMVILLIIIFGVMFATQRSNVERKSEEKRQAVSLAQDKLDPLNEYVTSCLDIAAKSGLTELGKQGGYLFQSQGGPVADFSELDLGKRFVQYDNHKVAYAVIPPLGDLGEWISEPPAYPWDTFPEVHNYSLRMEGLSSNETLLKKSVLTGYFGRNILPNLRKPDTDSIEEQLETFIENSAASCLRLDSFQTKTLTIMRGQPNVSISFTENQVVFDLRYPLNLSENRTGAVGRLEKFAAKYDIRLKKIIEFMELTTNKDVTDISFNVSNISSQAMTSWSERSGFEDDEIVFIRDAQSKILGTPYTFLYARKNRPPALGLINSSENQDKFDIANFVLCGVFSGGKLQGPIIKTEGNSLVLQNQHSDCEYKTAKIPLKVWDPDENSVSFAIEVNEAEYKEYQLSEGEVGPNFGFRVRAKDGSLFDSEELVMRTTVVTPR